MLDFTFIKHIWHFYSCSIHVGDFHFYQRNIYLYKYLSFFQRVKCLYRSFLKSLKCFFFLFCLWMNVGVWESQRRPDGNGLIQRCDRLVICPWSDWRSVGTAELHAVLHADKSSGADQWEDANTEDSQQDYYTRSLEQRSDIV